jgi:hypothetical protein
VRRRGLIREYEFSANVFHYSAMLKSRQAYAALHREFVSFDFDGGKRFDALSQQNAV